ncbi:hypothetical protein F3P66_05390 [Agrobacterium fabrum]|uniref:Uncharacterized protein n=1 Tax=Agrobacterium fabrum (strain C58 / ATCC 33970) TaxID=176299 RepID=Q8U581_AGRFC|nr:conserved hypothetical protein [Agrobacterium fabrum str. C58]QRM60599.1 hypothetical protein F3P66_05390 [Agrobacterium fabrum]TRB27108.1 hypothetical protein EXN51_20270 [Agrobacterium fabrum]
MPVRQLTEGGGGLPPLPCRASPPQVGRSICGEVLPILTLENEAVTARLADLPPCGGDARQGRGGKPHPPSAHYPLANPRKTQPARLSDITAM